jgi:hypothetical protein
VELSGFNTIWLARECFATTRYFTLDVRSTAEAVQGNMVVVSPDLFQEVVGFNDSGKSTPVIALQQQAALAPIKKAVDAILDRPATHWMTWLAIGLATAAAASLAIFIGLMYLKARRGPNIIIPNQKPTKKQPDKNNDE